MRSPRHILLLLITLLASAPSLANTARDYFEDGNRLFEDDLYWAALLRYREAREAGLDSPVLHYNEGVAHYKAGQHRRARSSLERAASSPSLAPLAHFNLGLNANRLGETREALRWFRLARDQERNPKVASLARRAIKRIRDAEREDDPVVQVMRQRAERERRFTNLDVRADIGFGNNDNVYRTPSEPYTDFSQAGNPTVTPTVQSGAFMPVDIGLRYNINSLPFEGFYTAYRLSGRYYQDKELDSANEYVHEFSFGNSYSREKNGIKREVFSAFRIAESEETYFDPDDGQVRNANGVDIGDRFNFRRYGPYLRFRQTGEKLGIGAIFEGQLRNYEDIEEVPEYDHEFLKLGLHAQYKFAPSSLARITLEGFTRHYGDRPSYDLDGRQRLGNPPVEYQYINLGLLARQRVTRHFWFGVEYERTDRKDGYVGYYDYTRDAFEVELNWSPSRRIDVEANGRYSLYDYPNAFAFNNDTLNRRTLETLTVNLLAKWRLTKGLSIEGELRHRETSSNDLRIQYDQNLVSLSVRWQR